MGEDWMVEGIRAEFAECDLGDARLNNRLERIATTLAARPDGSFPTVFEGNADLEAFYRFVRNPRVNMDSLIAGHITLSQQRLAALPHAVVVHDTTDLHFGDARVRRRPGLGRINRKDQGMLLHTSLAVDPKTHASVGVVATHLWTRKGEPVRKIKRPRAEKESARWLTQIERVAEENRGADIVHVADCEADIQDDLAKLVRGKRRFVIRARTLHRVLCDMDETHRDKALGNAMSVCTREVELSSRPRAAGGGRKQRQPRTGRDATLSFSALSVRLRGNLNEVIPLNVVRVWEAETPEGQTPVEWVLFTTEPIDSVNDVTAIVDIYRDRWRIEEYFKTLKSGCAYEARQLDSFETLTACLGLFIPIASQLTALRTLERTNAGGPASDVLTATELRVLKAYFRKTFSDRPTIAHALEAIARLGGHIKNNGAPGLIVLARGYKRLAEFTTAATALEGHM